MPTSDAVDVLKNLSVKDVKNVGKMPCARDSFLNGIGGGVAVGAIRYATSRRVLSSSNWAVGAFCALSIGTWEYCRYQWGKKMQQMDEIVEKLNELERRKAAKASADSKASPS